MNNIDWMYFDQDDAGSRPSEDGRYLTACSVNTNFVAAYKVAKWSSETNNFDLPNNWDVRLFINQKIPELPDGVFAK